jgi:hypothetical protein
MSQTNSDESKKRAEMLTTAKQMLIQEYTAMRGTNHQQWLRDSQISWKTKGILIAYPHTKLFPTEQEVVTRALELYNRSNQPITNTPTISIEPTIQETDIDSQVSYSDAITPSITEQLQAAYNSPTTYSVVETREITEPPPTTTDLVQAGGDFVIIDEPIESEDSIPEVEPIIEEPVIEEPAPAKHSLLRSVLSGWLSKNKDKDAP